MDQKNVIKKSALSPTVLIVGGAGFIGSHLAEALLAKEARVIVLDNFSTGKDVFVHALLKNPKFALFDADINLGIPPQIESVDYIFHLAGLETYLFDKDDVNLDSLLTNALGTKNVLDFAQKSSAKFLLASSIDVYKGLISPVSLDQYFGATEQEEKKYSLIEAKRYAEALVWEYYKKNQIDVRIARLPEVYGPRMNLDSSGSLGSLLRNLLDNKDLVVYGEGTEKEHYLYISDVVAGLIKALFTENTAGTIYTFVAKETHTVLETTYLVKGLANVEPRVVFKQKTAKISVEEPRIPDKSTLRELNWDEKQPFKEGIAKTLKWFGYEVNEHNFKPAKILENKEKSLSKNVESIMSLHDEVKEEGVVVNPVEVTEASVIKAPRKRIFAGLGKKIQGFIKKEEDTSKVSFNDSKLTGSAPEIKNPTRKSSNKVFVFFGYLFLLLTIFLVFVGIPLVQTYYHAQRGTFNLRRAQAHIINLDADNAQNSSNEAFKSFYKAQDSFNRLGWLFTVTRQDHYFNDIQKIFTSARYASKSAFYLSKGSTPFIAFWESIKPTSETQATKEVFSSSHQNFVTSKENLQLALAELSQVSTPFFRSRVNEYSPELFSLEGKIDLLSVFSLELPELTGLNSKKSYLILFQNSNEIRATGGFIGSYATLDFVDGKIANLIIDDVYNPDGQIKLREIKVEPPLPIKEYLNEDVYYIRNANWNPDFTKAYDDISNLFFRVDGRRYDGIIAVDLYFVENILKVTGPVYLTAYNEEITPQNLYERAQFHSEFNYEEGSDQKRAFLTVLGGKLLERIFSLQEDDLFALTEQLQKSMEEKHLLVHIPRGTVGTYLTDMGWNGKIKRTDDDFLYVVNSNLGGTKANYYVKNQMEYNVLALTRDGLLRAELNLNYEHTGIDSSWPGGPYTNYVRVYTKAGSKLTGAKLVLDNGASVDVFQNVKELEDGDLNVFEYGFTLQPKQNASLIFEYDLAPELILSKDTKAYNLLWQKQPGTHNDTIKFRFNPPFGITVKKSDPVMLIGSGTAEFSSELNRDLDIKLDIN
jgi:UDP-glucuronate decarboxylase